jgi:replicative DNA helicase
VFSLEMKHRDMLMRMAISRAGVDGNSVRMGRLRRDEYEAYQSALLQYTELPVWFDDEAGSSVPAIHAAIRHKRATNHVGLVIVDYIQLVEGSGRTREQEVSSVSRGLKLMATHFDCPVVALSQINREGESRSEPEIRDLRESGGIGNDANTIMILHRRDPGTQYFDIVPIRLLVKKQRNGPLGYVDLLYHKRHLLFREADEESARGAVA